jgi:hypothetical protein
MKKPLKFDKKTPFMLNRHELDEAYGGNACFSRLHGYIQRRILENACRPTMVTPQQIENDGVLWNGTAEQMIKAFFVHFHLLHCLYRNWEWGPSRKLLRYCQKPGRLEDFRKLTHRQKQASVGKAASLPLDFNRYATEPGGLSC